MNWWMVLLSAFVGAIMRTLFGYWKAYRENIAVTFDAKRVLIELLASLGFGTMGLIGVMSFGLLRIVSGWEPGVVMLFAFWGADSVNYLSKKVGIKDMTAGLQKTIPGLNARQQKGLNYVSAYGSISNDEYQKLVQTSHITAERDLGQMVKKGLLKRTGRTKGIRYTS